MSCSTCFAYNCNRSSRISSFQVISVCSTFSTTSLFLQMHVLGLACFLHFSIMLGAIMQIAHRLMNIFVRHPRVSIILPILDGMGTRVLTPTYRLRRIFRRFTSQFVLSHYQAFLGFLDLDLGSPFGNQYWILLPASRLLSHSSSIEHFRSSSS